MKIAETIGAFRQAGKNVSVGHALMARVPL
jgi:hypothetical protein